MVCTTQNPSAWTIRRPTTAEIDRIGVNGYTDGYTKAARSAEIVDLFSAPVGTRTPNLLFRRQMLYPIELQAQTHEFSPAWSVHHQGYDG